MKYYVDSKGGIHEESVLFKPEKEKAVERAKNMSVLLDTILGELKISNCKPAFDYMIETFGSKEKILFFTKTSLSASDDLVKKANLASSESRYSYLNKEEEDILNSIFATEKNHKTEWWLIKAEFISFERNNYDNQYIIVKHNSMLYADFKNRIKKVLISQKEVNENTALIANGAKPFLNKYQFISERRKNIFDISDVISFSLKRDERLQSILDSFYSQTQNLFDISNKDIFSNEKNNYFSLVRQKVNRTFPVFADISIYIRQIRTDIVFINYKKNIINVSLKEYGIYHIAVTGTFENPVFLINGNIYNSTSSFKEALKSQKCFFRKDWYKEIEDYVMLYIKSCYKSSAKCKD